jgi:hypothetical protein
MGDLIRKMNGERNPILHALDTLVAAQDLAKRSIEDLLRSYMLRAGDSEQQMNDIHIAEDQIRGLKQELEHRANEFVRLDGFRQTETERAEGAEARVKILEAEIKALHGHAAHRGLGPGEGSGVDRMSGTMKDSPRTETDNTRKTVKGGARKGEAAPLPLPDNTTPPVGKGKLVDLVIAVMKRAEGKPLSTPEIHAQLPANAGLQQRQIYNLLYRRAAAGTTFVPVGEGKFILGS